MTDPAIEKFRKSLDVATLDIVDALRSIIAGAAEGVEEHIKWNAPSFMQGGEDRITLGIERKGGVRVVLHRGAKPKPAANFHFDDHSGLARWPAPDRGVIVFRDRTDVENCRHSLKDLCARWLKTAA